MEICATIYIGNTVQGNNTTFLCKDPLVYKRSNTVAQFRHFTIYNTGKISLETLVTDI